MIFHSLHFLWFFALVWGLYWLLRKRVRWQNLLLLAASYFFYGYWDWRFLGLILISTLVDFGCGLAMERHADNPALKKRFLWVSLVVNLGALVFFKYFNFFMDSARVMLEEMGFDGGNWSLRIILPVGISFYTFQTLSYSIDRYRGVVPAERNFINFAFFVSFFPQLVAGPIVRAREFLPQATLPRKLGWHQQAEGVQLILWGLFKKVVVADNLAPVVDAVFAAEGELGIVARLLAVYAFAVQIYCDFSGYTDIARGTARMLGFTFPQNFKQPYFASDPSAFWRRWHITLSTWLRDYLYISLGGNRKGPKRTYVNLSLTMVLGGLWHGAAWNYVLWGAYQGLLLVAHRMWCSLRPQPKESPFWVRAFKWGAFFQLVCFGWLIFRAQSMAGIVRFLSMDNLLSAQGLMLSEQAAAGLILGGIGTLVVVAWDLALVRSRGNETPLTYQRPLVQAFVCLFLYVSISLGGSFIGNDFIYFQF
jgi:alginate O-acetyltransferase complex protein AlgI